jgi:hypothetical protein
MRIQQNAVEHRGIITRISLQLQGHTVYVQYVAAPASAPRGQGWIESSASLASARSLTGPYSCCVADRVSECHTPRSSSANAGCLRRPTPPPTPAAAVDAAAAAATGASGGRPAAAVLLLPVGPVPEAEDGTWAMPPGTLPMVLLRVEPPSLLPGGGSDG